MPNSVPSLKEVAEKINFLLTNGDDNADRRCHFGLIDVETKERAENPKKYTRVQFRCDPQTYEDFHKQLNRYITACGNHPGIAHAIMIRLLAQLSSESITKLADDEQPIKESLGDA